MDLNRATRSNSGDSTTSIGSTDSGFGVHDAKGQIGHLNGSTVTKGTANQKPSSFFGWLKSLFGFGGSDRSESTTTSLKIERDDIGDQHDASARTAAIEENIEAIEILAQKYPANTELQSILKDAQRQSKIANTLNEKDSLGHEDLVEIKNAFDRVKDYAQKASKIDIRETRKETAATQLAGLDRKNKIQAQRDLMQAQKESGLFEKQVKLKDQNRNTIFKDESEFRAEYKKLDDAVQSAKKEFGEGSEELTGARAKRQEHIDAHPQFKHLFGDTIPGNQTGVRDVASAINTTGLGSPETQKATEKRQELFRPPGI